MNSFVFLLLKRIRLPLMLLIISYAVVILGFVLIPGQDDQGNVWHMSFFHAFYFVSFMGSTIGFGEIPYEFTNGQRMWTVFSIYATVTIWLYSIGALINTLQNPAFKKILKENEFRRKMARIKDPFYLICGYGDTGKLLAHELSENHFLSVVIDIDSERIDNLEIDEPDIDIPALAANASDPRVLKTAGLTHEFCRGVIALTNKDEVNLKIAITARLLSKERMLDDELMVVCRAETAEAETNMASFGTSHIINPFEIYARRLALSVRSPSAYLIYEWLTNPYHKVRSEPINPPKGTWVICGYGRFGKAVSRHLNYIGVRTIIIEASPDLTHSPEGTIIGRGTEAVTLREAKITEATAIVAGTDNDANNLSIVLTAQDEMKRYRRGRKRNKEHHDRYSPGTTGNRHHLGDEVSEQGKLFSIARQNYSRNETVFKEAELDFIMQPASIVAGEILSIIKTPLLSTFLSLARRQKDQWANFLISRISGFIDEMAMTWMLEISENQTPAVMPYLQDKPITIGELQRHPRNRDKSLNCVVLLVHRKKHKDAESLHKISGRDTVVRFDNFLLPENDFEIQENDQLLICGDKESMNLMCWSVTNINIFNYLLTGYELAGGYVWRWIYKYKLLKQEKQTG